MSTVTMASNPTTTTVLPIAGVGGSFYDTEFPVPIYARAPNNVVTWRMLDTWNNVNVNYAITQGIAAGLVWATLTYMLALTPTRKRTTPFHSFMLLGLVFLLIHLMIDIVSSLTPGLQSSSAYTFLTFDIADSVWTNGFVATFAASQVTGWFAFIFAAICLWLQAKGLMTGVKVRYPAVYRFVLTYLVVGSVAALGAIMAFSIQQILELRISPSDLDAALDKGYNARLTYLAFYALCIGSFSLVSMVSVVDIVWKRPSSVIKGNSAYASALNLVGLLCAQSFVIPFIFCIMQIVPQNTDIMHPQIILLPSVYLILPLGSLFMTVNSNPNVDDAESPRTPTFPPNNMTAKPAYADSDATLTNSSVFPGSRPSSCLLDDTHIERELSRIDAMESSASTHEGKDAAAETDAMLKSKETKEKEVVVSEKMMA